MILGANNWNLLAAIISKLLELYTTDTDIKKFIARGEGIREKYQIKVNDTLKQWGFPENTQDNIYDGLLEKCEEDLKECLLTALIYIDGKLSFGGDMSHFMKKGAVIDKMLELNTNVQETEIILLPKAECMWEKKKRSGLNSLLENYIYIHNNDLGGYTLQNHVMNLGTPEVLKNPKWLRIAVSPLTNANILQLDDYEREDVKRIAIKGLGCAEVGEDILEEKILWGIQKASQCDVDIIMYPEMLGTERSVQRALKKIAETELFQEKKPPFLALLPTVWKSNEPQVNESWRNGNNTNTLYAALSKDVIDGESYKATIKQQKQNPYLDVEDKNSSRIEDIHSDKVIHILHINGIGRIVFPVCADLISEEYRERLQHVISATLILCPSFSKGFDDFIQITAGGNAEGSQIIWCNSCAVQHLYKNNSGQKFEVEDICCANISGMKRNYRAVKPCPKCSNQCKNGCLFYIDIPMKGKFLKADTDEIQWTHLVDDNLVTDDKEE